MADPAERSGPDLTRGIAATDLTEGAMLLGHAGGEAVLLARLGGQCFAIGATCTHYSGPLAEGLMVGDTIRCPWHHACFSLRTGAALQAPALEDVACWRVEEQDGRVFVREKLPTALRPAADSDFETEGRMVIVGGGAAGNAAAEMLRREGYVGPVIMISDDAVEPYDRPNLSKDYLAGEAPAEYVPLRPPEFYRDNEIELLLNTRVTRLHPKEKHVDLSDGRSLGYDALLLATGAEPVRLEVPGADQAHVKYLRSRADCEAIIAAASGAKRVVVIGSSFIGMEVAAALHQRGLAIAVAAPDERPMARVLGPQLGDFLRKLHEEHGVVFHLRRHVQAIGKSEVRLDDGTTLPADLVIVGIGVHPRVGLAEAAGLALDRGIVVNAQLETSAPGIFAAGDIARWPDPLTGERIRVEHWVVAERQGQVAARNMMGRAEAFTAVPFFWTRQYGVSIDYVGHAETWDAIEIDGSLEQRNCALTFRRSGRRLAVATIGRNKTALEAEVALATSA
ncbi:MAG: FAD-dependent oxidoreductase [Alphaproteobacteria bacterium]|nr:FAD-dependent oxidoreductase [Alphaproteobacteria bacterium]